MIKNISRIFSLIAGIIATIIGAISFVGVILSIFGGGLTLLIKPIILCVLFFSFGVAMLSKKGGDVSKLIIYIVMIVIVLMESFVWPLSIFTFTEVSLGLLFRSADAVLGFAMYYKVIFYAIMICTLVAMVLHIIAMATAKKETNND